MVFLGTRISCGITSKKNDEQKKRSGNAFRNKRRELPYENNKTFTKDAIVSCILNEKGLILSGNTTTAANFFL